MHPKRSLALWPGSGFPLEGEPEPVSKKRRSSVTASPFIPAGVFSPADSESPYSTYVPSPFSFTEENDPELERIEQKRVIREYGISFLSANEMADAATGLKLYFPNLQLTLEAAAKIESYLLNEFESIAESFRENPSYNYIRISSSNVGKELLPFSLMCLANEGKIEQVKVLFSSKESGGVIGTGSAKKVKIAMELVRSVVRTHGVGSAMLILSDRAEPSTIELFVRGHTTLSYLFGVDGVVPLQSGLIRYCSKKSEDPSSMKMAYFTELFERGDLYPFIEKEGMVDDKNAMAITETVLTALASMHSKGVRHGDIKPENILLGQETVVFADFDFGELVDRERSYEIDEVNHKRGSYGYLPPEQAEVLLVRESSSLDSKEITGALLLERDVYALGLVISLLFPEMVFTISRSGEKIRLRDHITNCMSSRKEQFALANDLGNLYGSCEQSHHWLELPSSFPQSLVWHMIHPNPNSRFTANGALAHFRENKLAAADECDF